MRNLGVRVERADVRWVGARRKKSTQCGWAFELILLFTSVDGLFCLGPRENYYYYSGDTLQLPRKTITTSTVETLYSYPEKQLLLVQWIHSTASGSS